jgi:undecaprenyl-diphosphatase
VSFFYAPLLGLVQGLTEFLPISSSGHLALAQMLIPGFRQPGVVLDAGLHLGTAASVVWFERRQIVEWFGSVEGRRILGLLLAGTAATGLLAFPLRSVATAAFGRTLWVGACLIVTAAVLLLTRWLRGGAVARGRTSWRQAVLVGLAQGVAVFPGLSRSGMTIAAGLAVGLDRTWAARFSFLLSVPSIVGVTMLEVYGQRQELASAGLGFAAVCAAGAFVAGLSGLVALRIVLHTVSSRSFHRFAWYCLPLGALVVLFGLWGS